MIEFVRLSARNFRSWARLDIPLSKQGVVCIKGLTGSGKSSIWTALHWGLYGSTPEATKVEEVRGGRKPTAVRIVLRREGEEYVIRRYRGHPEYKNKVFFQGMGIPRTVEDSYVKSVQGLINTFLGVSETLFLTTTYFAQRNFHHFHTLTDTGKKAYLEAITYGSLFEQCEALTRERVRKHERDIDRLEGQLQGLHESIAHMQTHSAVRKQQLKDEAQTFRAKIDAIEVHLNKLTKQQQQYAHFVKDHDANEDAMYMLEGDIRAKQEDIERYQQDTGPCPRCGLTMLDSLKQERIHDCDNVIEALHKKLDGFTAKEEALSLGLQKYEHITQLVQEKYADIDVCTSEIALRKAAFWQVDTSKELQQRVANLTMDVTGLQRDLAYSGFWQRGFSFAGLRTFVLTNAIQYLSQQVAHYLHRVVGDRVEFCLTLENARLLTECNGRSYASLSGGERQSVDLCTGLALRDLAECYSKAQFNLLVLDEPHEGLDKHLTAVAQSLLLDYAKPSTFLITHQDIQGEFNQLFTVSKKHGHSFLERIY